MKKSNAFALAFVFSILSPMAPGKNLYVDYSYEPDPDELLRNEVCILHPNCQASLAGGQKRGNEFYAYLSLTEISPDEPFFSDLEKNGIKLLGENKDWKSRLVDIRQQEWADYFIQHLAKKVVDLNYDGFFIDTIDSIELLDLPKDSENFLACQKAAISILSELKKTFPTKKIIINRGFDLLKGLDNIVDGVVIESVFSTTDIEGTKSVPVAWATTEALVAQIERTQELGYDTYVIDYVAPSDRNTAIETAIRIRGINSIPYVGTRKLDGTNVYERLIRRKILVVYGYDPAELEDHPVFPGDTLTLGKIQTPLEWMGYELEYHNISRGLPDTWSDEEFCGVIIDESLTVPTSIQIPFAKWLAKRIADGNKTLFLGTGGLSSNVAKDLVFTPLGIVFKGRLPRADRAAGDVTATHLDKEFVNYEVTTEPAKDDFEAFQAPKDSRVLIGLEMKTFHGETIRYDPVFLSDWGGCLLAPYASYQVSPEIDLSHVDPFKFLSRIWPSGEFPAPDVTTRQGLRIYYSHIDGDGFVSIGNFPGRPICGEVLYDKVLKDLPFPVTVSIVEAEIRGHMLSQVKPDVEKHESAARKIFELPHIEPASHSYSHPYVWDLADKSYYKQYDSLNLPLKLTARYPKIELNREIGGSLKYIKERLTGESNPPKIFLWSGNCRPSTEALRLVREAGIENMNGGNTILSRRYPGISAVAPKLIAAEGEIQVFASNQNEFYYTDGWKGPFFSGFKKVIETFEMTESPRRLKPVNVYYHFYSAERQDSLLALQEIYDWCRLHELHLMTTAEYARMIRDSFETAISELEPLRWRVRNQGKQQTFRIPAKKGNPDLDNSRGVIGYRKFQDSWYIATDGSEETIIALSEKKLTRPHLVSSTERIQNKGISQDSISFHNTNSIRKSKMEIGGLDSGQWSIRLGNGPQTEIKSDNGVFSFQLLPNQTATISRQKF